MSKRKIVARELVADIRSGLDDDTLMRKYELSAQNLDRLFRKLVEVDFISVIELQERARLSDSQVTRAFVEAQKAIDELICNR
jgi:hypothetical protein